MDVYVLLGSSGQGDTLLGVYLTREEAHRRASSRGLPAFDHYWVAEIEIGADPQTRSMDFRDVSLAGYQSGIGSDVTR